MAAITVKPQLPREILPHSMPSYSYHMPGRGYAPRVMLSAIKDGIYHPSMPSYRQIDMDNYSQKLPDEHCRTSTLATKGDYERLNSSYLDRSPYRLHSLTSTDFGRALERRYDAPVNLTTTRELWSEFLTRCPERYNATLPRLPPARDLHYRNYAVRYERPEELTKDLRYNLTVKPSVDRWSHPLPTPAQAMAVHRPVTVPSMSKNISSYVFRPPGKNYYRYV